MFTSGTSPEERTDRNMLLYVLLGESLTSEIQQREEVEKSCISGWLPLYSCSLRKLLQGYKFSIFCLCFIAIVKALLYFSECNGNDI